MRHIVKSRYLTITCLAALALSACSEAEQAESTIAGEQAVASPDLAADMAPAEAAESGPLAERPSIGVTLPRMAYLFDYSFRLPGEEIAALQLRHADMCEALGPAQCMIVGMDGNKGEEPSEAHGTLELAVAAPVARGFVRELAAVAEGFHGEQVSAQITGEDVSKQLIDTEAQLRSRTELRDRLQEVLRTRRGSVEELVEAERQVAAVNQEIDQARSWLAETRGRVQFSRVRLTYASATPVGSDFMAPVAGALGSLGSILGVLVAGIILLAGIAGPFVAGALGLRWWQRRRLAATPTA